MKKKPNPKGYSRTGITTARLREILADGKWKSLEEIVALISSEVSPEGALRRCKSVGLVNCTVPQAVQYLVKNSLDQLCWSRTEPNRRRGKGVWQRRPHLDRKLVKGQHFYRLRKEYRGLSSSQIGLLNKRSNSNGKSENR